ncbi:MAG: glutaredoxin [Planctomycetota bacterium]
MDVKHISGKNKGKVMLYTLSTCIWCRKVKDLLGQLGAEYSYIDVDTLEEAEKSKTAETTE